MDHNHLTDLERRHVWHPFTQMRDWEADEPLFIESGDGVKVRDLQGREYYDANSSLWVNLHGHRRPEIDAAIAEQLSRVAHTTLVGLTHRPAAELAARLAGIAPAGLTRVFFSDGGAEAVEIAVKMSYQYWRHQGQPERKRFVALAGGYHGDTIGAVSVGGVPVFHELFRPLLFDADFAPNPAHCGSAEEAAAGLEAILERRRGEVAAVILEPVVHAAAGMLVQPPGYLRRVRELCDRYDTLLIADEIATGFGRTGRMFACEHEGIAPDLMCVAKSLTGGYLPLAATLASDRIYEAFLGPYEERKTFFHGHSYTANPLACAAALASLNIFEHEQVLAALPEKVEAVRAGLAPFRDLAHVGEIRQCGLMVGIDLVRAPGAPYEWADAMGVRVCKRARTLGLITRPLVNVIVFMPPLSSTIVELQEMLSIIHNAIRLETEPSETAPK
ncbi:MAG: adenosylmethionine--8-amino-7-oxononanoate transaminase [Actinomycetota bacterium]